MVGGMVGKKLGMTQVFDDERRLLPVTVIEVVPSRVTQLKTIDRDGYEAVQIGFDEVPERKLNKPQVGHLRAKQEKQEKQSKTWRRLQEFPKSEDCQVGDIVKVDIFSKGEEVSVQGISKGKGFQGVMKRHNYGGGPASHGSMFHRAPGSIGNSSYPSRVWKNKALPGQMGNERVTVKGLRIVDVRSEENLLLVSGSVPGRAGATVVIRKVQGR